VKEKVYVVDNLVTPLLGKPAISKLDLISVVEEINIAKQDWLLEYPTLFSGLGSMENKVVINLKKEIAPFAQMVPRRVAAARRLPLKKELMRMEQMGVIEKIETPTEWCSPCIVVPKKNGKIRVCIDFTKLNMAVKREYHPLPATEESLSLLGKSKIFTKLDANCGYWQMKLSPESQKYTTFITPFGRYICKRLPFGISSAPEIFQREMQKILTDMEGVICQMDDILICSENMQVHQQQVKTVLEKLYKAGITLNAEKCEFNKSNITFLGHVINQEGIHADPKKVAAIKAFPVPKNKTELKRFFGMVNYLGKFSPSLSNDSAKLRELLCKNSEFSWNEELAMEFNKLKDSMTSTPTLVPYSLEAETMLSTDASSYGLGAALMQKVNDQWRPIAFASRAMSEAEKRYAQVEKEALAICWASSKFHYYLAGREFAIETDHKPLVSILGEKELSKLPLRVQRFRLKMLSYSFKVLFTPGNKLVLADALSRAPIDLPPAEEDQEPNMILGMIDEVSIAQSRLRELREATANDDVCCLLLIMIQNGWTTFKNCPKLIRSYYTFKDALTAVNGLIFYMNRVFIPISKRNSTLKDIHKEHQGENKCIARAKEVIWWPGMTKNIRDTVRRCPLCEQFRRNVKEPLISTPLPKKPWWRLATDLFVFNEKNYLLLIDYYSRYIAVEEVSNTESKTICEALEKLFCMLGVPNILVSDNGPQFGSEVFANFLKRWDVIHHTSSPKYPQSNGEAERAVQTVKSLMKKNSNINAALCAYRDSPLANGYSPAQLLFRRGLNSMGFLNKKSINLKKLKEHEREYRSKQAHHYNRRHRVQGREVIETGQKVMVSNQDKSTIFGQVMASKGREVAIRKEDGTILRRNRNVVSAAAETYNKGDNCSSSLGGDFCNLEQRTDSSEIIGSNINENEWPTPSQSKTISPKVKTKNTRGAAALPGTPSCAKETSKSVEPEPIITRAGRKSRPPKRLDL